MVFKIIFLILILGFSAGSNNLISYGAQFDYPWSGITEVGGQSGLVAKFYQIALALVGVTAFAVMVFAGVLYIVNASNPSKQKEAMDWIWAAVFGVVLLLGAYLLFYTINPELTNLTPPRVDRVEIRSQQFSTSSAAFQGAVHQYQIDQCSSGWAPVSDSSCDNLGVQRQDSPYNRPDAPQVCCKMSGN